MNMKDVKKITLPNKVPVYDTDYRQLGYIHFSGNERISFTNSNIVSRYARNTVSFKQTGSSVGTCVLGDHDYANDVHYDITNYETSGNNRLVYAQATIFQSGSIELYKSSSTEPIHTVQIDNYEGKIYLNGALKYTATSVTAKTSSVFSLGCATRKTSTTTSYEDYWTGNIFSFSPGIYNSNTGWEDTLYVPAQRKSDNVCGLYCMKNNTFYPMTGTEITTNAAGNIVTEEGILLRYDDIEVKKIQDNKGTLLWGSYDAFPYRRLEYIHFNGAEYINDTYNPYPGMKMTLTFKADSATEMYSGTNRVSSGSGGATTNNTIGCNSNGKLAGWLGGSYRSYDNYSALTKHAFTLDRYYGRVYIDGTQVTSFTAQYGGTNTGGLYYGCRASAAGDLGFYMKANIYRITITNGSSSAWVRNMVPCQRKSDGVCGLYNVPSGVFFPMQGTTITNAAAGPVVDEYWDLTDPF